MREGDPGERPGRGLEQFPHFLGPWPDRKSPRLESGGRGSQFLPVTGPHLEPSSWGFPSVHPSPHCGWAVQAGGGASESAVFTLSPTVPYTTECPQGALPSWTGQGPAPPFQVSPPFLDVNLTPARRSHASPPSTLYPDTHTSHLPVWSQCGPPGPAPGPLTQSAFPKASV